MSVVPFGRIRTAPSEPMGMSAMANKVTEAVAIVGMTWWWIGGALLVVVVIAVLLRPHWFN